MRRRSWVFAALMSLSAAQAMAAMPQSLTVKLYRVPGIGRGAVATMDLSAARPVSSLQSNWSGDEARKLEFRDDDGTRYRISLAAGDDTSSTATVDAEHLSNGSTRPVSSATLTLHKGQHLRYVPQEGYVLDLLAD